MSSHLICLCSILGESYIELQLYLRLLGLLNKLKSVFVHCVHCLLSNNFSIYHKFTISCQNPCSQMRFGIQKFSEFRKVEWSIYHLGQYFYNQTYFYSNTGLFTLSREMISSDISSSQVLLSMSFGVKLKTFSFQSFSDFYMMDQGLWLYIMSAISQKEGLNTCSHLGNLLIVFVTMQKSFDGTLLSHLTIFSVCPNRN